MRLLLVRGRVPRSFLAPMTGATFRSTSENLAQRGFRLIAESR